MAIYHFALKSISRAAGRSSVAASAYRSASLMKDDRTGEVYDYRRKQGLLHADLVVDGERVAIEREAFWNQVEQAENRKDAKVAREIVLALPHELDWPAQKVLALDYAKQLSERTGWGIDIAMHAPGREGDQRNVHVHLLCTTRVTYMDADNQLMLGLKTRDWDVSTRSADLLKQEREHWANLVNEKLLSLDISVDERSFEDQGLSLLPTIHLGVTAMALERQGMSTERGNVNRERQQVNEQIKESQALGQLIQEEQVLASLMQLTDAGELEQAVNRLYPKSVQSYLNQDNHYQQILKQHHALNRDVLNLKARVVQLSNDLQSTEKMVQRFREAHPVKAKLHDLGILKAKVLVQPKLAELKQVHQDHEKALTSKVKALATNQAKLDWLFHKKARETKPERESQKRLYERALRLKQEKTLGIGE